MTIKSFLRQALPTNNFSELQLPDGRRLRIDGNTVQQGAEVQLLAADGSAQAAADATYFTQNGYKLTIRQGRISAVESAQTAAESPQHGSAATPGGAPEQPASMNALQAELQALRQQLEQQQRSAASPAAAAYDEPAPSNPYPEYDGVHHFSRSGQAAPKAHSTEEVAEAVRMIRRAKMGDPEYRFNRVNAKKFATGSGVNFNDLLARCPDIAQELFHGVVIEEGLAQNFNILDVNVQGDASLDVELPNLDDQDGGGYLKGGIACSYTPSGQSVLNKKTMTVSPWHYYREYCPKEWGNSFRGMAYVNDEELPYEAVILEYLFGKIRSAWEESIMVGDTGGGSPFQGLLTQANADTAIPAGQKVNLDPTDADAVAEFEKLLGAVPPELFANVQDAPLLWFVPNQHLESYVKNYRTTFSALPYNNRFEKFGPDSALKRATFVPTAFLTDHQILTAPGNLYLGVGKDMEVDVQFHDSGKEQYLYVRVEGHTGVGYPLANQMVIGEPTA